MGGYCTYPRCSKCLGYLLIHGASTYFTAGIMGHCRRDVDVLQAETGNRPRVEQEGVRGGCGHKIIGQHRLHEPYKGICILLRLFQAHSSLHTWLSYM